MPTTAEIVTAYGAAWNEADAGKRRTLLERAWADDGTYTDPTSDGAGRDALLEIIAGFHIQSPGGSIVITSGIDQHHNRIRFAWDFRDATGKTVISGIDAGELADDGRISKIVGFWGAPPALR